MTPTRDPARPSIFATLLAAREAGERVAGVTLPDEAAVSPPGGLHFVGGLRDQLSRSSEVGAADLLAAVVEAVRDPNALGRLYGLAVRTRVIGVIDDVIDGLVPELGLDVVRFDATFEWLARFGSDREPVKLAIAMLGRLRGDRHLDLFRLLGAHDEFTAFAAVAISCALPPAEARAEVERLAREVRGWGRIDLVRRLADEGGDEAFRRWLVREGFRNEIDEVELALVAATEGDLLAQLRAPGAKDDEALLDGAGGILGALAEGRSGMGMDDYPDSVEATRSWLAFVQGQTLSLKRATALGSLVLHAETDSAGWGAEVAQEIARRAGAMLRAPETTGRIERALRDGDAREWWAARAAAPQAGIDLWPFAFARQAAGEGFHWFDLMETEDPRRVDQVLKLATRQLPLDKVATGPADDLFGDDAHRAASFVVQGLRRFPGKGWPFVAAALRSPVVGDRHGAIRALDAWGPAAWPAEAEPALRRALAEEPRDDVRGRIAALLAS